MSKERPPAYKITHTLASHASEKESTEGKNLVAEIAKKLAEIRPSSDVYYKQNFEDLKDPVFQLVKKKSRWNIVKSFFQRLISRFTKSSAEELSSLPEPDSEQIESSIKNLGKEIENPFFNDDEHPFLQTQRKSDIPPSVLNASSYKQLKNPSKLKFNQK